MEDQLEPKSQPENYSKSKFISYISLFFYHKFHVNEFRVPNSDTDTYYTFFTAIVFAAGSGHTQYVYILHH
jgi:hypothetical protein